MAPCALTRSNLLNGYLNALPALLRAARSEMVPVAGSTLRIPGPPGVRASVVAGNVRMRALLDALLRPGDTVVDVGANIGAIAVHAARVVGPSGVVVAIEPAPDNLGLLRENLARNGLSHVQVVAGGAGPQRARRTLFLRGAVSAVNSFYAESCYGTVSGTTEVEVAPLDDLVPGPARLVKIDVEGAELEVLEGMSRLLSSPALTLVVEWHPLLQRAAGAETDALPHWLLARGFTLHAVGHLSCAELQRHEIEPLMRNLMRRGRPVELLATRP
ncbi:MAG: FkbM family methyltransferase [Vicinamibacterales bacterium]